MFGIVVSSVGIINVFFFLLYGAHLDLHVLTHSFPTRRSADLVGTDFALEIGGVRSPRFAIEENVWSGYLDEMTAFYRLQRSGVDTADRSEEHTSELQSLMRISYAVLCLKKKTYNTVSCNTHKMYTYLTQILTNNNFYLS